MRILVTGATGFLGRHLVEALTSFGYEVVRASRAAACGTTVHADYTRDFDASVWQVRLSGIDVVINSVGMLRESRTQTFEALHVKAPIALFDACAAAKVRKVIQMSALAADERATSRCRKRNLTTISRRCRSTGRSFNHRCRSQVSPMKPLTS